MILGGKAEETLGIELLADIRTVWAAEQADRFTSKEMAAKLVALEDRPWSEYRRGDPITQRQLAQLLKPFGIEPRNLRTQSTRGNGYCAAAFEDAFRRYLPPSPSWSPDILDALISFNFSAFAILGRTRLVKDRSSKKPKKNNVVKGVKDGEGAGTMQEKAK